MSLPNKALELTPLRGPNAVAILTSSTLSLIRVLTTSKGRKAAANGGPPYIAVLIGFVVSTIGVVAAYGTWRAQKWGIVLAIIVSVFGELDGLGGILFAPLLTTRIMAGVGVVLYLLVVLLCLWRERKPVLA